MENQWSTTERSTIRHNVKGLHDASHILLSRDPCYHNIGTAINKTYEDHYDKPNQDWEYQDNKRPQKHISRQFRRHRQILGYIPYCNRPDDTIVLHASSRPPISIIREIKEKLDQMEKTGVIEKVMEIPTGFQD